MSKSKLKKELEAVTSTKLSDEAVDEIVKDVVEEVFDNTSSIGLVKDTVKDTKLDSEESCKGNNKVSTNGDITIEHRQDSGEYIEIAKVKGKYTTTALLVAVVIVILTVLYGCTSTYISVDTTEQVVTNGKDTNKEDTSKDTSKGSTKTPSVQQTKIL